MHACIQLYFPAERCYAQAARKCQHVVQPMCCMQVEVVNDPWLQHAQCYTTTFFMQKTSALDMTCTPEGYFRVRKIQATLVYIALIYVHRS